MKAQPRGMICHWVANNVPTLGFFSLVMGMLSKNGNLVKASEANIDHIISILQLLARTEVEIDGVTYRGVDILRAIGVVTFEGRDEVVSSEMSLIADGKVIWGGETAVGLITQLPKKEGCEQIVFGPKYSLAVIDRGSQKDNGLKTKLRALAQDVVLFNQMACSSPQVVFFEEAGISLDVLSNMMAEALSSVNPRILEVPMPEPLMAKVINARGRYLLDEHNGIKMSEGLSWTVLMEISAELPEPVYGRCLFVKKVRDLDEVVAMMTNKVQAVTAIFSEKNELIRFAEKATAAGVERIVSPGGAHNFSLPWDGMMAMSRMVRWVTIR